MRSVRLQSLLRKRLASALVLGIAFLSAPAVSAQEVEPNSSCAAPQDLSGSNLPLTLQGSLNSPPATPDVDFYRVSAAPYSLVVVDLDGNATGGGTLPDPYLGVFDETCNYIAISDDYNGTSSHLEISMPASGEIVIGATAYGDWEFTGTGGAGGTYRLSVKSQELAEAIGGRVVDAATGAPLYNKYVTLYLCNSGYCSNYAGSTMTDSQGAFRFENGAYTMARPLVAGDYQIAMGGNGYESTEAGPFTVVGGQDLNVGDLPMQRTPAIGSVQGRLIDELTGAPLSGTAAPFARVELRNCHPWGCLNTLEYMAVAADGTFRFLSTDDYRRLPPGTYQISASGDQYQPTLSATFEVADGQHVNIGDLRVKSLPVRINLASSCGAIPAEGGECRFSMRVTNGASSRLEGEAWAIVNGNWIGSVATHTSFEVGSQRSLSLAPGDSVTLPLAFQVPATLNNGATICVRGYAAQRPHEFNTLGAHDLFCFTKGYGGFDLVPEPKKHEAVKKAEKP